jgi:hypothetical protein
MTGPMPIDGLWDGRAHQPLQVAELAVDQHRLLLPFRLLPRLGLGLELPELQRCLERRAGGQHHRVAERVPRRQRPIAHKGIGTQLPDWSSEKKSNWMP